MLRRKVSDIIIDIPKFQRITDMNRVNYIFDSMRSRMEKNQKLFFPGCIIFAKTPEQTWIIDGLHRMEVYKRFLTDMNINHEVYCQEFQVANEEEARELFEIVNDSRSLPEMPDGVNINQIQIIVKFLMTKYPNIFSNSKTGRVNRPHLHFNGLQEALAKVDKSLPPNSVQLIEDLNSNVMYTGFNKYLGNEDVNSLIETAQKKGNFFLGIIPNYRWVQIIFGGISSQQSYKKKHISSRLRQLVWKQYAPVNSMVSECFLCQEVIQFESFHCGHDIPESKGGETNLSNLRPICSACNLSMGTKTMQEMKTLLK